MNYKKATLLSSLAIVSGAIYAADKGASDGQKRPNIIIINADDLGYGDLSANGAHRVQTPNVDRVASEGVRFTNFHATSATSTPSRFSLLTGKYAWRVPGTGIAPGDA
ncbi:MAG: sulfatase-like hydrolase/transferase, partial [Rikenellaceae bacterium]